MLGECVYVNVFCECPGWCIVVYCILYMYVCVLLFGIWVGLLCNVLCGVYVAMYVCLKSHCA